MVLVQGDAAADRFWQRSACRIECAKLRRALPKRIRQTCGLPLLNSTSYCLMVVDDEYFSKTLCDR